MAMAMVHLPPPGRRTFKTGHLVRTAITTAITMITTATATLVFFGVEPTVIQNTTTHTGAAEVSYSPAT